MLIRTAIPAKESVMTYIKLGTGGAKHHLAKMDQSMVEFLTLCGRAVTGRHSWTLLQALEGDECEACAQVAFGGGRLVSPENCRSLLDARKGVSGLV